MVYAELFSAQPFFIFALLMGTFILECLPRRKEGWVEFIGVLRHMQRYFSHICDGTDVQADWRSCTYGRVPNPIDISQGSLTCPSYTDTGPPFLVGDSDTPPNLVAFYVTLGIRRAYSRLKPPASSQGRKEGGTFQFTLSKTVNEVKVAEDRWFFIRSDNRTGQLTLVTWADHMGYDHIDVLSGAFRSVVGLCK